MVDAIYWASPQWPPPCRSRQVLGDVGQSLLQERDERAIDELRCLLGRGVAGPGYQDEGGPRQLSGDASADRLRDPAISASPHYQRRGRHGAQPVDKVVEAELPQHGA